MRTDTTDSTRAGIPVHPSHDFGRALARSRGLTLIELIVVITLIGVLTAALAVGVTKIFNDQRIRTATIACNQLRSVSQAYFIEHPEDAECPTPEKLQELRDLDSTMSLRDPWGTPYAIECVSDEIIAKSAGPDRAFGTPDDIRVPGARRASSVATAGP